MKHTILTIFQMLTAVAVLVVYLCGSALVAESLRETNSIQNPNGQKRLLQKIIQIQEGELKTAKSISVELVEDHPDKSQGQGLYKYQLVGATNAVVVSREVWSPRHLSGFALVSAPPSRNYLVWLDGASMCYLEVASAGAKPSPEITRGITSAAQADGVIHLGQFEGSEQFWGTRADNCELGVLSANIGLEGDLTFVVTNVFGKQFSFSKNGGEWRASGEAGELRRKEAGK